MTLGPAKKGEKKMLVDNEIRAHKDEVTFVKFLKPFPLLINQTANKLSYHKLHLFFHGFYNFARTPLQFWGLGVLGNVVS